jgi:hypothetical protein
LAKSNWIIGILIALLVGTNAWWAYNAVDAGITYSYSQVTLENNKEALAQSLAVIEAAAQPDATKQSIVRAARTAGGDSEPFEKDGYVWVGSIGLKFDSAGHLIGASRSWSPP